MALQTNTQPISITSTRFTTSIERRVLAYIRKHAVFAGCERVVVAVSGGPDSTALLVLLFRLRQKLLVQLTVGHFDHQLRSPAEGAADLEFVRSLASSLDLPFVDGTGDVRAFAEEDHLSIEDAARRLRYGFLREQASKVGATTVAVGHTLDDQAETVLLHLLRGAGLAGIGGMSPRAAWPFAAGPELARPLLFLRREETEQYCRETGVKSRSDPTNDLIIAVRNQVRHEVMPMLRRLNPRIEEALARFAATASADSEYLDELAAQTFSALAATDGSTVSIGRRELAALPRALAARLVRLAFAQVHNTTPDTGASHVEAVLRALAGPPGSQSLPAAITATIDQTSLIIAKGPPARSGRIEPAALPVPGRTVAGVYIVEARLEPPPATLKTPNRLEAYLDADKASANLTVRSRRPGDRLRPLGLGGDKKLQDILVDAKVPARQRDGIPLVCAGDQVVWVVGHCLDERYALHGRSRRSFHLVASLITDD